MPSYKLHYFDARGRAEVARLMFAASGTQYEDCRIASEEWPKHKADMPFGQMPVLEVDGKKFSQSIAIFNYVARVCGYYSSDPAEAIAIDEVMQAQTDLLQAGAKIIREKDEAAKATLAKTFAEEEAPKFMDFFSNLLKDNGSKGCFVGNSLTLADFAIFDVVNFMTQGEMFKAAFGGLSDKYPEIKALCERVMSNERLKTYIENRKPTKF